jgi:hypothetical protein
VAAELGIHEHTVGKWRRRFLKDRCDGLLDEARPGRPRTINDDQVAAGVQLVISDACRGLVESVADFLPEARYQRCMVHFSRNVFSHVPSTRVREVSHMLKAIHAQESREAADKKAQAIVEDVQPRWAKQPTSSSRPSTRP